jgi:hypothetical protein
MVWFKWSLTPELTGAGGPIGPQGTNIGHQNREAMANVGVRVERFVRLRRVGRVWQAHSMWVRSECSKKSGKRLARHGLIIALKLSPFIEGHGPELQNLIGEVACEARVV